MFAFEPVPAMEIDHGGILGIFRRVSTEHPRIELKAEELQLLGRQQGRDLRNRVLIFLNVEQQVAAIAGRVEIARRDDGLAGRAVGKRKNLLPAAPDVVRAGATTSCRDGGARRIDVLARGAAVEAEHHDAIWLEQ